MYSDVGPKATAPTLVARTRQSIEQIKGTSNKRKMAFGISLLSYCGKPQDANMLGMGRYREIDHDNQTCQDYTPQLESAKIPGVDYKLHD